MNDVPSLPVLPDLNAEACRVCDAYHHLDKSNPAMGQCFRGPPQIFPSKFVPEMQVTATGQAVPTGGVNVVWNSAWPMVRPNQRCCAFKRKMTNGTGGVTRPEPLPEVPIVGESESVQHPADIEPPASEPL